jgi:hypothetical protein
MAVTLSTIVIDASEPAALAAFWVAVLGWESEPDEDGSFVVRDPTGTTPVELLIIWVPEPKRVKNRLHLDLTPSGTDQRHELERLVGLGAVEVDIGQGEQTWVVLADPEGNEFCLLSGQKDAP